MVSLLLHGAVVMTALVAEPSVPPPPSQEIAVEIVHDEPKSPEPAKKEPAKAQAAAAEAAKPPPELKPALPPPPPEPPQPAKTAQAPPPQAAKPPPPEPPKPAPPPRAKADDAERQELMHQLAELRAERDASDAAKAAAQTAEQNAATEQKMVALGLGPLPDSFQAVALPSTTNDEDAEPVGYSEIVFSQLAKAKGLGARMGRPGSAGVRFAIDEHGALLTVSLAASSGIKELDDEAIAIVHRAAPFPAPPKGAQRDFSANVSFVAETGR